MRANDTDSEAPTVSLVVPVLNEAENIAPLTDEIVDALTERWSFELIYVDDGSTDGTADVIRGMMPTRPWLRLIAHDATCGKAAGMRTGAIAARSRFIVALDGDGQNDPAFIEPMLQALISGAPDVGLVAGQRLGRKDTWFKKIQSRVANAVRASILRDGTRDTGCGFKAFPRDVFLQLPQFDGLHRFLPALVRREGYEIAYVDVVDRPRRHGVSKYGFWNRFWVGIGDLLGVWWLIHRRKRLPKASEVRTDAD